MRNFLQNLKTLTIFSLLTLGVGQAWGGNVVFNAPASASPATGGSVSVSPSNQQTVWSAGVPFTSLYSEVEATFTYAASANTTDEYVFKGWSTSSTSNSGTTSSSFSKTYKQKGKAGTVTYNADEYYAIFARMRANSTSDMTFGTKLIGSNWNEGTTKSVTINYVHAGKITATITGTNKTEFSLSSSSSSQSTTVVSNNTNSETNSTITVYFKPASAGTKSATLTIHSNNNLSDITISLSGTGQATVTPTDTCKLNDSYYIGHDELNLDELWTSDSPAAKRYKIEDFKADVANEAGAITPAITGNYLSLGQAGELTISMAQSATTGYHKDSTIKVINILKNVPTFSWNSANKPYYHNTTIANIFSTDNHDCSYEIVSDDELVASEADNTLYIWSKKDTAHFTVTQSGNYYWKGISETYDVTPSKANNHVAFVLNSAAKRDALAVPNGISSNGAVSCDNNGRITLNQNSAIVWTANPLYYTIKFTGIPDKLMFTYSQKDWTSTALGDTKKAFIVYESATGANNSWTQVWSSEGVTGDESDHTPDDSIQLAKDTRYLMFFYDATYTGYYKNITVTELKKFEPSVETIDFETQQIKVACPNKTFSLDYANVGHHVTVSVNDDAFTVSPTTITTIGGDKEGTYTPITVSYSTENIHKTASDAKITIEDELGNKKYISLVAETKKKKQTLQWIDKYNVDQPSVPINKEITGAATCSPLTDVRYTSSDETVIEILDEGRSFRALMADTAATITARQAGNGEWNTISICKKFRTTDKKVQVILWNQNLTSFTTDNTSSPLQAKVYLEDSKTGTLTFSADRTDLLEYISNDETIVSVEGTTLYIHKNGSTTLKASVPGDEDYEATSAVLPVVVNEPIAGCQDVNLPVTIEGTDMVENGEIVLFNSSTSLPELNKIVAIDASNGVPGVMHFSTKGTKFAKIFYGGEVEVRESPDKTHWSDVKWHAEPTVSDSYTESTITLSRSTRYVKFTRPQGGTGYHHVNSIYVTPAQYIESDQPKDKYGKDSLGFGAMEYTSSLEKEITIYYANAKSNLSLTVDNSDISLNTNSIFIGECGADNSAVIKVKCTPSSATPINAKITVTDENAAKTLVIRVVAEVVRAAQHIDWTPTQTELYTIQSSELNEQLPQLTDKDQTVRLLSKDPSVVSFSGTTATIHKPGTVTLCASHPGTPNYEKVDTIKHDFTFNITPTEVVTAPTVVNGNAIVSGTALNNITLSGGAAQNTINNGSVSGTFSVQNGNVTDVGQRSVTVLFTPSDQAMYSTSTCNVNINVIAREATDDEIGTVTAGHITYGQKLSDAVLSMNGTLNGYGSLEMTDEQKDAVKAAGTYENIEVTFTPTNTNIAPKVLTVSVTVDKVTPTLSWTSAPTELAYNATDVVYAAGSASDGAITYSIIAGGDCASIYATTGALTITKAGSFTVQASQAAGTSHTAPVAITQVVTVNKIDPAMTANDVVVDYGTAPSTVTPSTKTGSVNGTWSWNDASSTSTTLTAGDYTMDVTFTPTGADANNYNVLNTTVTVTVNPAPVVGPNKFTGAEDNDWYNSNNWTNGIPTGTNPDVIVSGALVIDEDKTVGALTIESTGSVTVVTNGNLTVTGVTPDVNGGYGDLHVATEGNVVLGDEANLKVRHFTLDAKLAGKNNLDVKEAAASGQVENPLNLDVNGEAYFQMTFDPKGKISFGWYDFVVPFPVNISDGIFREGDLVNHLVSGVDFIVQEYSETRNANKQKAWSNFYGTMQPGRVYTIGFNYDPDFDQNVFVFKKASGAIGGPTEFATQYTAGSGTTDDFGWNGLGNGMLQHGYITGDFSHMQVYNHAENKYDLLTGKNPTFAIGTSFFVQVDHTTPMMTWNPADADKDHPLYAPKRETFKVEEFLLSMRGENQIDACDHFYISGSEEATGEYVIGHDLRKMGNPTEAKTAQMWATKNGKKLCDIETRMVNYGASSDLNFFAPQAGTFELMVEEMPEDATLYLTYNGNVIWDLTASPYVLNLTKGTTTGYGLRIEAANAPQITTGVEDVQGNGTSVRKVIIDNTMYIITPEGEIYNAIGKKVQ